jgi:curved DNA-binding protein CbpA
MMTPYAILGVAADAGDEEIKKAYLAKVRLHPPDRDPEAFQQVRAAYEAVRGQKERLRHELFHVGMPGQQALARRLMQGKGATRPDAAALRGLLTALLRDQTIPTA